MTEIFDPDHRAIPYAEEGTGPALVLLPGCGLNIDYLGPLAHSVSQEDFRLVRIGSRRPQAAADAPISLHDLAQDVADVMTHLGIDHAWVGGHAFGGTIARTVALDHHARVNGVLLLAVEGETQAADEAGLGDAADADILRSARDGDVAEMQRAAVAAAPDVTWMTLADAVPVLVVQGSQDAVTPPSHGDALQASAPGLVSVVRIDGGGHLFPATHVGQTSWAIEDYLDWD